MEQSSHHGSVFPVITVTRLAVMAALKTHWKKNIKMLEINLLLLVQVEGTASGCALREEFYMGMD